MTVQRESIELTEIEAHVLTKVTAAVYLGREVRLNRKERAALRRASVKAQDASQRFPFVVAP